MQRRNIGLCVVFAIIPCGIYMFYWMYQINETARRINPQRWNTDGGMVILFTIITCGIYGYYWNYQMGKAFQVFPDVTDNSILYLILSILNLDIVNYCLIQNDINRYTPE